MRVSAFVFFVFCLCSLQGQVNLDSGLVACYALNGHGAEAINNLDAIQYDVQPANDRFMNAGRAVEITSVKKGYMLIPSDVRLKSQTFAFSAWLRPSPNFSSTDHILFTRSGSNGLVAAYSLTLEDTLSNKKFRFRRGNAAGSHMVETANSSFQVQWYHVFAQMDGSRMEIYLNGVFQSSVAVTGTVNYQLGKQIVLGSANETGNSQDYTGLLDNIRFYDRLLTAPEISSLYQNDPPCLVNTAAPVANFTVNSSSCVNSPVTLKDLAANYPLTYTWIAPGASIVNAANDNISLTYTASGTHTVTQIVENSAGKDSVQLPVVIHPLPSIGITQTILCRYEPKLVTAAGAQSYTWMPMGVVSPTILLALQFNTVITVIGKDANGCVDSVKQAFIVYIDCYLGLEEMERADRLHLYPNPGSSLVEVESSGMISYLAISSPDGRLWYESQPWEKNVVLDLTTLPAGLYFLRAGLPRRNVTIRIIKE